MVSPHSVLRKLRDSGVGSSGAVVGAITAKHEAQESAMEKSRGTLVVHLKWLSKVAVVDFFKIYICENDACGCCEADLEREFLGSTMEYYRHHSRFEFSSRNRIAVFISNVDCEQPPSLEIAGCSAQHCQRLNEVETSALLMGCGKFDTERDLSEACFFFFQMWDYREFSRAFSLFEGVSAAGSRSRRRGDYH